MNKIYPYAGFWKRAVAFIIDSIVLSIPLGIGYMAMLLPLIKNLAQLDSTGTQPSPEIVVQYIATMFFLWLLSIVVGWLYYALMESSKYQATLGKMALGIKVTDSHGRRLSFAHATGRLFAKMISGMTLYFGFYMAGFTRHRQALHDIIANTFVVNNTHEQEADLPALPFSTGFCITSVVVAITPILLYMVMICFMFVAAMSMETKGTEDAPTAQPPTATIQQV